MRRRTALAISAAIGALLWEPLTSVAMCGLLGTLGAVSKWVLPLAAYYYWRDHSAEPLVAYWFPLAAVGAAMVAALPALAVAAWPESRRLRLAREGEKIPEAQRARSDAFGSNDWMSMEEAKRRFPGPDPQEGCGGVVVGEAYRVDRDPIANAIPFDPKNRETWGQGGKHPVLIDPCTANSSHGAVVSPSGGYKTTAVTIPTLAAFTTSIVVHDPSGQVEPMTARMRRAMGHKVASVGVEPGQGFNVLDCIDITDPLAETYVEEVVEQLVGETPVASENAIFTDSAKELLTCLLADLLWDPAIPPEQKTLREFRERVRTPEKKMRGLLGDVAAESKSKLARDYAGSLAETVSETFSGVLRNAASSTKWLSIKAYADMVSGGSFKAADLTGGKLSVFVQIPIPTMKANPGIARVVFGALLGAAYRAKGAIAGRILFPARRGTFPRPSQGARGRSRRRPQIQDHPGHDVAVDRPDHRDLEGSRQDRVAQFMRLATVRCGQRRLYGRTGVQGGGTLYHPRPIAEPIDRCAARRAVQLEQQRLERERFAPRSRPDLERQGPHDARRRSDHLHERQPAAALRPRDLLPPQGTRRSHRPRRASARSITTERTGGNYSENYSCRRSRSWWLRRPDDVGRPYSQRHGGSAQSAAGLRDDCEPPV